MVNHPNRSKKRVAWCFNVGHWCYDRAAYFGEGCSPACGKTDTRDRMPDHDFEPGAYGVCRRCGGERHPGPQD